MVKEKTKSRTKKSGQVAHPSAEKVKSMSKFYPNSSKKSKPISRSEEERRKQLYKEKFINSPVRPETRSDDKVNIMFIKVSLFLSLFLIQDVGQEVTRMIEEEMKK